MPCNNEAGNMFKSAIATTGYASVGLFISCGPASFHSLLWRVLLHHPPMHLPQFSALLVFQQAPAFFHGSFMVSLPLFSAQLIFCSLFSRPCTTALKTAITLSATFLSSSFSLPTVTCTNGMNLPFLLETLSEVLDFEIISSNELMEG